MHNVPAYGYPTPPASPSYDNTRCAYQQQPFAIPPICQSRYVPVAPEERLGKFLGDSLKLIGIIGTGAYGVVYLAVDIKTGIRYAVKTLSKFNADGSPLDQRQIACTTSPPLTLTLFPCTRLWMTRIAFTLSWNTVQKVTYSSTSQNEDNMWVMTIWPRMFSFRFWMPWNIAIPWESSIGT